eukprot:gnl/MRDRNA2_/MRDRNA2_150955_c0_seq1.p1 gnl/MRDRNA2_/MRDRNA2_150955_c0~~gnl/MRDRNA2_/MRDRNA2_150955_c0_seq1.p1  ORF type:complete len:321 (+),score=53.56 gnl/MRDRNA2_/MRDRNA2_150955_c0_seq1:123-965(+)
MFATKRATLTSVEGSLLAGMFSGRWEGCFDTDKAGNIFLDHDPDCFEIILHHLRFEQLSGKQTKWLLVPAPEGKTKYFRALLEFLNMINLGEFCTTFTTLDSRISSFDDGSLVRLTGGNGRAYALGGMVLEHGTYTWVIHIKILQGNNWIYAGIINSTAHPQPTCCMHSSSFGWANGTQVYIRGDDTCGQGGWRSFQQGDKVTMELNVETKTLTMKIDRLPGGVFTIKGLENGPWRVHVNLFGEGDEVQLLEAEAPLLNSESVSEATTPQVPGSKVHVPL